jgi:phenylpyruvate tautomerase PptA (4-oxalocrotonate tautomerase family)
MAERVVRPRNFHVERHRGVVEGRGALLKRGPVRRCAIERGHSASSGSLLFYRSPIAAGRFDTLTKHHMIKDFTKIILLAEEKSDDAEAASRVWVTILEIQRDDWGIGGHTDWLRDYESALNTLGTDLKPR